MEVNAFRRSHQETRARAGQPVGPHGEDRRSHRRAAALHHHLPRRRAANEETVRFYD